MNITSIQDPDYLNDAIKNNAWVNYMGIFISGARVAPITYQFEDGVVYTVEFLTKSFEYRRYTGTYAKTDNSIVTIKVDDTSFKSFSTKRLLRVTVS